MDITIIPYSALPCRLMEFTINGIEADVDDFGDQFYYGDGHYGCSDSHFEGCIIEKYITKACEKYNITRDEYFEIIGQLEEALDVGPCGYCV